MDEISNEVTDPVLDMSAEEQAIADKLSGKVVDDNDNNSDDLNLPSDKKEEGVDDKDNDEDETLLAGKYKDVDALKQGIANLNSELPKYVLDGMNDAALEQHYNELRGKQDGGKKHLADDKKEEKDPAKKDDTPPSDAITPELWANISTHFNETGGITEDMYAELGKAGIPSEIVDNYIDGLSAKNDAFANKIVDIAGSAEQVEIIRAWADENIDSDLIDDINAMPMGDKKLESIKNIKARYDAANPEGAKRIVGNTQSTTSGSYDNQAQYIMDVSDKRYGKDKRYTKTVDDKFSNSSKIQ